MWAFLRNKQHLSKRQNGFTIVELLIVVVVIAILAAITIVAYNGIQNRAKASAAQQGVAQAAKKVLSYAVLNSEQYPADLVTVGVTDTDTTYQYSFDNTTSPRKYCITATNGTASYYLSNTISSATAGACDGHGANGVTPITNLARNPHAVNNGWASQTPTGSTISYPSTEAQDGGYAYKVATTQSGPLRISSAQVIGNASAGDVIAVSLDINAPAATSAQIEIGISSTFPRSPVFNLVPGWNRVYGEVTIPAGTATGAVTLVQFVTPGNIAANQTWLASRLMITRGPHTSAYADGNSSKWVWNGTQNNATSTGPPISM